MTSILDIMDTRPTELVMLDDDFKPKYSTKLWEGEKTSKAVQNTQLSRVWGQASEMYFASRYYEWADSEDLQLLTPTLDRGWDFMIERNGKKIQVKRFNPVGKKRSKVNSVKLRRSRASPRRGTTCNNNYDIQSFDYLVVHDVRENNLIIADVAECFNADGSCKSNASVYPTVRSKGLTHLGWEVFR